MSQKLSEMGRSKGLLKAFALCAEGIWHQSIVKRVARIVLRILRDRAPSFLPDKVPDLQINTQIQLEQNIVLNILLNKKQKKFTCVSWISFHQKFLVIVLATLEPTETTLLNKGLF